jgi:hypothetical protein
MALHVAGWLLPRLAPCVDSLAHALRALIIILVIDRVEAGIIHAAA